ncbi:MAG: dioxygenase, partial [Burkholderiaceae bacterium]
SLARAPVLPAAPHHEAVHDVGNFDPKLFTLRYDAPGAPKLAERAAALLGAAGIEAQTSAEGGLDDGIWTALRFLYPNADVPVLPLAFVPSRGPAAQEDCVAA